MALREFAPDIMLIEGPIVRDFGFPFTTRMVVVRLSNGSLWVESPVPVSPEVQSELRAWGSIRYLVVSTPRHVWRLQNWHRQFPDAELWACRQMPARLRSLPWTGQLGTTVPKAWAADLEPMVFRGSAALEEVCWFHAQSRTLLINDLIQQHPKEPGKPLRNLILGLTGGSGTRGEVPIDIRWTFRNRAVARQSLADLLAWDFDRLIIAHGPCVERDAKDVVRHAFRWLQP